MSAMGALQTDQTRPAQDERTRQCEKWGKKYQKLEENYH